ncbi:MAG: T9SS type A sorting domain-containing protein [Ferruginibacter sp.]|nr:T9SS type A sorting domain-containing protein [Ferruginibacter sp.]
MSLTRSGILFLIGILFCLTGTAQEKYSKVKIPVTSSTVKAFVFAKLNLDHYEYEKNVLTGILNKAEMNRLRQSGFSFELLIDDVVAHTIEENRYASAAQNRAPFQSTSCQKIGSLITTPASFGNGGSLKLGASAANPGYFTYAEMVAEMQNLAALYPNLVSVYTIGNSAAGAAIYGVKISHSATAENKPEVLYTGLQHAREAIGGTGLIFFLQYMAENYNSDDRVKNLLDNRQLFVIPCLNPDGYSFNYSGASGYPVTGGGLWRKNRRNTGGGASNIGVDLNRNYGIDWGNCVGATTACGSSNKTDDTYYGTSAFSEPETQALRNFVTSRNFINAIDQHCYGPYYSLPYGRPSLHSPLNNHDSSYYTFVPALMGFYNGHRAGNSPETVNYEVAGGIKDWLLMGDIGTGSKGKVYGMTGEAGGGSFWAPVSQLIQLCKEACFQNMQLAYAAGAYYDIEDKNDITINSLTGKFVFQVKRVGLGADPVTISLVPLENMHSVGAAVTKTVADYYDTYTDSISYSLPATFVCGQKIKFAWKVESGGIITYDTVTKFFNPLTLLADDMEGSFSTNWNASISPSGPTGWAFTAAEAFEGSHSMTESPSGNYTTSSTRTVTYNSSLDLSDATAAYLSFWVKYRAENFRDKLQVQASTNGSVWVPICGSNMVAEDNTTNGGTLGGQPALTGIRDNWTHELFDLAGYLSAPALYLRFRFTSDNDGSAFAFERDNGFNLDNLKLVKTTAVSTLAVKFGGFNAQLLFNNTVRLNWEAYTDLQHDYFEVQHATDKNSNFISIARIKSLPPYASLDNNPANGNNYYRIKEVDKTGLVTYSNVIKVNLQNSLSTIVYPNPVVKELSIKVRNNVSKDNYTVLVTDITGRKLYEQAQVIETGSNEIKVSMEKFPSQVYFLKIMNIKNEVIATEKFIKQ